MARITIEYETTPQNPEVTKDLISVLESITGYMVHNVIITSED